MEIIKDLYPRGWGYAPDPIFKKERKNQNFRICLFFRFFKLRDKLFLHRNPRSMFPASLGQDRAQRDPPNMHLDLRQREFGRDPKCAK
jgi:hypothetical protein